MSVVTDNHCCNSNGQRKGCHGNLRAKNSRDEGTIVLWLCVGYLISRSHAWLNLGASALKRPSIILPFCRFSSTLSTGVNYNSWCQYYPLWIQDSVLLAVERHGYYIATHYSPYYRLNHFFGGSYYLLDECSD